MVGSKNDEYAKSQVHAGERLDHLPIISLHKRILFLIGAGLFLDAFEIFLGGAVIASLLEQGWSTFEKNAAFTTMTFIGFIIGAWMAGILGDRYGRRISFQINLMIFGVASILATFAPNMEVLILLRFIMGVGMGAELVIGYATLTEFVPKKHRGRLVAILSFIPATALFISAWLSYIIIPTLGWRYMFLIVGIGAMVVWFMRKTMPESPRWLESKGRYEEAEQVVKLAEAQALEKFGHQPLDTAALDSEPVKVKVDHTPLKIIFTKAVLPRTIVATTIMVVIGIALYGLVTWLPSFFYKQGHDIVKSLGWTTVMSLGGPVGGLISICLVDRMGRKPLIITSALIAAVICVIYPLVQQPYLLMLTGFLLVTSIYIIVVVGQAIYVSELFDTSYRLRGSGFAGTMGRIASALVQPAVVFLFAFGGLTSVVLCISFFLILLALIVGCLGVETRNKSLEEIT